MKRFLLALAGTVATLVVTGSGLSAQNVSTTGQIGGRVRTAAGEPVAAVIITARSTDTGLLRTAITNEDGGYVVRLLPPGNYSVRTQVIGFQSDSIGDVRVAIGQTANANFVLSEQAISVEGIEVVADRSRIDVSDASVTQLVSRQQIEDLPSLGRDFTDFIELSGLVAPDPGATTGGQFAIAGARPSGTNLMIDGVDANNAFFGENRGGSRIPFTFSLESIQEFQIITNGFDVEYGNYSGGIVNVVTRGGTNEWEGSLYGNIRDEALTAGNFIPASETSREVVTDYEVQQFAGRISGPILRNKAFFLLSADGQRRREPQLPITPGRYGPDGARPNEAVAAEFQRYLTALGSGYGITDPAAGYAPFSTSNDAITLFGRVDWNLNNSHRLSARHNYSTFSNDNEWSGIFDFAYGRSRAEEYRDDSHSFVAELQSVLGANTFNVMRFQYATEDRPRQGFDLRPALTVTLSNNDQVRYGGTFASFNNIMEESKVQFIDNFTHSFGSHTVKFGGNLLITDILNQFQNPGSRSQGAGEFVFANVDDFVNFRPSSYYRPMQLGGGIARSEFDVSEWSVYLQDEWLVTPRLTATMGLRYDRQSFGQDPLPVVDVERAFGWGTGVAPTDDDNISPRLSLAYDLGGEGNRVVRAGAGYFYGRVPYVLGGNVLQTELPTVEVVCSGSLLEGDPDAPPSLAGYDEWSLSGFDNPAACAGQTGAGGVPTYSFWTEGFEFPETFKANLGYEGLLTNRTRLSVDLIFSETTKQYSVRNLNLRDAQFVLENEGGRRIFTPAGLFNPGASNTPNSWRNTDFGDVYANYNDGRARAYNATAELAHNFNDRFSVTGSYTFTRAYDNVSESCCTSSSIYSDPTVGAYGPNDLGGAGDTDRAWGRSNYSRDHTIILSGFARELPLGLQLSAFWRLQSGRPWTPEVSGDLNGDGVRFNDRPFVFAPADLPLAVTGDAAQTIRDEYAAILAGNDCVGDYVGQIVERNTCSFPWTNRLDLRVTKRWNTFGDQGAEFQADLFNVMNGVGRLLCNEDEDAFDDGPCGWGRVTGIFGSDRNLLSVAGFDPATQQIQYRPGTSFGQEDTLGDNLLLQFQAQLGFKYFF